MTRTQRSRPHLAVGDELDVLPSTVSWLQARARMADPAPEVRRAYAHARRGDDGWRRRLQDYHDGETLIVELTACALIDVRGKSVVPLCFAHAALWVERRIARPAFNARLRALARRDFQTVGTRLRDRGIQVRANVSLIAVEVAADCALAEHLWNVTAAPTSRPSRTLPGWDTAPTAAIGAIAAHAGDPSPSSTESKVLWSCPRCRFTFKARAALMTLDHCPRCLAHGRIAQPLASVELSRAPASGVAKQGATAIAAPGGTPR